MNAQIDIQGGRVTGVQGSIGDAIKMFSDTLLTVSGGIIVGAEGDPGASGGTAAYVWSGSFYASGGTFIGGDSADELYAGHGLYLRNTSDFVIDGGTYQGGTSNYTDSWGNTRSKEAVYFDDSTGVINGGNFTPGDGMADSLEIRYSTVDIYGGGFSGGFHLAASTVNIYGYDLVFDNDLLTGTLFDGTTLNNSVTMIWDSNVVLHGLLAVPEPATMLLLGSGLIGLAGFRKRFRKR